MSLTLAGCAVAPPYVPTGERSTQARLRIKASDRYAYPALLIVKTEDDAEPKEQMLAIFTKGWMGIGKAPTESERIGMPESGIQDSNMPVLERYVTGNRAMRMRFEAMLDGSTICGASGAFTPATGHDYEVVVSMLSTSIGFHGQCGLMAYELIAKGETYERMPLMLAPIPPKTRR